MKYYLAIDIGASSGRHILGHIEQGRLQLEEVYRFENTLVCKDEHFYWDVAYLFSCIKEGIKACVKQGKTPETLGIDTWAVDYVLLDSRGHKLHEAYSYRDHRCDQGVQAVDLSSRELYQKTGIQFQKFNTMYQLKTEDSLENVTFLMIPDYFHYLLTGKMANEYTNLSTTQLLNIQTDALDASLLDQLAIPNTLFPQMIEPATSLGFVKKELQEELGCCCQVIVPATHDTGSAYMAAIEEDSIILSSGTWSLLGIETKVPYVSEEARLANFTNEGGYEHRYRFLKNIMGLWIIQEVAKCVDGAYSFAQLVEEARAHPFPDVFDVNDERFLKPKQMIEEITLYFTQQGKQAPSSIGEIAYCVYHSLAISYQQAIAQLEQITQKTYTTINLIGGGCQNQLLNEMIAKECKKKVVAGPVEATALGNLLAQLLASGVIKTLEEGRQLIKASCEIKEVMVSDEQTIC